MNPVHWRYVGHTVLIRFSALRGRLSQRQCWARTPPALPSRLRRAKEIAASFASASFTGLSVEMPVISQPGVVECKTVAERAAVWVLSVGTGDVVVLGARSVRRLQELGRSCVCQWAPTPLALMVRLGSLRVKSRILQNRRSSMEITTPGWNLQVTALGRQRMYVIAGFLWACPHVCTFWLGSWSFPVHSVMSSQMTEQTLWKSKTSRVAP